MYATSRAQIRKPLCGLIGGGIAISLLFACAPSQPIQSTTLTPSPVITDQPTPPAGSITTPEEAIASIQAQYIEVSNIRQILTPEPFGTDLIVVLDRGNHWDIVFSHGAGDCSVGCINSYFWYFSVWPDGTIEKVGEFSRVFKPTTNNYEEKGEPHWGIPW